MVNSAAATLLLGRGVLKIRDPLPWFGFDHRIQLILGELGCPEIRDHLSFRLLVIEDVLGLQIAVVYSE